MNVYSVELLICATAYVKANSKEEAMRKVRKLAGQSPRIEDSGGDVPISGFQYADPRLPEVSLSPAMTIHEPCNDAEAECVELDVPTTG